MRALLYSDLHLEHGKFKHPCKSSEETYYDLVLLAGDIAPGKTGLAWAGQNFKFPFYIAGNHEFYGRDINEHYEEMAQAASKHGVIFLQNNTVTGMIDYDGVASEKYRVIGATLWTDFKLDKDQGIGMMLAKRKMNDFIQPNWPGKPCIREGGERKAFTPESALRRHIESVYYIREELRKPFDGKTIVMTHHAPCGHSIHKGYVGMDVNHCYASNLEELIWEFQPDLWVHGHTHTSHSYEIGKTKIRCNPRGYVGEEINEEFDPNYIVDF